MKGESHEDVASAYGELGILFHLISQHVDADSAFEKQIAILRRLDGRTTELSKAIYQLGVSKLHQLKDDETERLIEESIGLQRRQPGNASWTIAHGLNVLAGISQRRRDYPKAIQRLEEAKQTAEQLYGPDSQQLHFFLNRIASIYYEMGDLEQCLQLRKTGVDIMRTSYGVDHTRYSSAIWRLANILRDQQKYDESESLLRQVREINENANRSKASIIEVVTDLQEMMIEAGRQAEAESLRLELIEMGRSDRFEAAAMKQILADDSEAHHELASKVLATAERNMSSSVARKAARATLLNPTLPMHLVVRAAKIAQRSLELESQNHAKTELTGCYLVKGLADYRLGKLKDADEWLAKTLDAHYSSNRVVGICFRALIAFHQGHKVEAERLLSKAEEEAGINAFFPLSTVDKMGRTDLRAVLALREARDTVRSQDAPNTLIDDALVRNALRSQLEMCKRNPKDEDASNTLANLYAWFDMPEEHASAAEMILDNVEKMNSTNYFPHLQASLATAIRPVEERLLKKAEVSAQKAVRQSYGLAGQWSGMVSLAVGMVEYRQAKYKEAELSLNKAIFENNERRYRALAMFFRAMTRQNWESRTA